MAEPLHSQFQVFMCPRRFPKHRAGCKSCSCLAWVCTCQQSQGDWSTAESLVCVNLQSDSKNQILGMPSSFDRLEIRT